jgi:hypothetical protein
MAKQRSMEGEADEQWQGQCPAKKKSKAAMHCNLGNTEAIKWFRSHVLVNNQTQIVLQSICRFARMRR